MSVYLCDMCDAYVSEDFMGCNPSPISMYREVCNDCFSDYKKAEKNDFKIDLKASSLVGAR